MPIKVGPQYDPITEISAVLTSRVTARANFGVIDQNANTCASALSPYTLFLHFAYRKLLRALCGDNKKQIRKSLEFVIQISNYVEVQCCANNMMMTDIDKSLLHDCRIVCMDRLVLTDFNWHNASICNDAPHTF